MPRKHIIVSGRVQGVGFRNHTKSLATSCHLTGWVKNLRNGEVEIEVQGYIEDIEKFLFRLEKGTILIRIDHMRIEELSETHEDNFNIESH